MRSLRERPWAVLFNAFGVRGQVLLPSRYGSRFLISLMLAFFIELATVAIEIEFIVERLQADS